MNDSIHVRPSTESQLANGIDGIRETSPAQVLTAVFRDPATGGDLPVTITLFQYADPRLLGVGVYVPDGSGRPLMGTVLRWDEGTDADPRVIRWERPHCHDDECGKPCAHRKRNTRSCQ